MKHPDLVSQTLFCEYARSEADKVTSLIGIFPDHVNLAPLPSSTVSDDAAALPVIPNLSIYSRTRLPLDRDVKGPIRIYFESPSGQLIAEHTFDADFVQAAYDKAVAQGQEYLTFIAQFTVQGLPITEAGNFTTMVDYGGELYFSGRIRLTFKQ